MKNLVIRKIILVIYAVCLLASSNVSAINAPSGKYLNDDGHTRVLWKIEHMGLSNYTARMNDVDIYLDFNAEDITKSRVTAKIFSRSVDTGYVGDKDFDNEISNEVNILNASNFPEITFSSTHIERLSDKHLRVKGKLKLLGTIKPVTLDVTLNGSMASHPFVKKPALGFSATSTFDRTDFGLTFLSGQGLGDEINIEIQAEFIKQ